MLCGVDFLIDAPKEIAIVGNPLSEQTQEILRNIHRRFVPNKVIALLNPNTEEKQEIEDPWLLFIDFKGAFNSVNHDILFEKLRKKGLSEGTINMIRFFYKKHR